MPGAIKGEAVLHPSLTNCLSASTRFAICLWTMSLPRRNLFFSTRLPLRTAASKSRCGFKGASRSAAHQFSASSESGPSQTSSSSAQSRCGFKGARRSVSHQFSASKESGPSQTSSSSARNAVTRGPRRRAESNASTSTSMKKSTASRMAVGVGSEPRREPLQPSAALRPGPPQCIRLRSLHNVPLDT